MTAQKSPRGVAEAYADAYANLTAETLDQLMGLCADQIVFHDPFNDIVGKPKLQHLLADMFENVKSPAFEVLALYGEGRRYVLKWRFTGGMPVIGDVDFLGLSEIELNEQGLVCAHIDYWDSGPEIYAKLPVLGAAVRFVRSKLAASAR